MIIQHARPHPRLRPYVERYWSWRSQQNEAPRLPLMVPGTGAELFFHRGDPFLYAFVGTRWDRAPTAHTACVRSVPCQLAHVRGVDFVSVRFRAGMLRHFCSTPLAELNDRLVDIDAVWGGIGRQMAADVAVLDDFGTIIQRIDATLIKLLLEHKKNANDIDYALRRLYSQHATVRVQHVVDELCVSRRHFQRAFSRATGVGPKAFHRNARFQHTLKTLLLTRQRGYLSEALHRGYFDQSHFVRDFKCFTGTTPSSFLREDNFVSHFYNTPLSAVQYSPSHDAILQKES